MIPGIGVVLESRHPQQLGRCWSELLGCPAADNDDASTSVVKVVDGMALQFVRTAAVKERGIPTKPGSVIDFEGTPCVARRTHM
ncbi:hypothetical protein [uncultured Mycolicibacterium sp.]|uniref:hypothetical protein n=1 Tax=uncultured Mycolicibacterium sp. TaxID=2320817 RepID=UPI0032B2008A